MFMNTVAGLVEASGYADKMLEAIAKLPESAEKAVLTKLCASVRADIDYFLENGDLFDNGIEYNLAKKQTSLSLLK